VTEQDRETIVYAGIWPGGDVRPERPLTGTEADILLAYLEWHRQTFELKCSDIDPSRLSERSVAPSTMSLHGLIRHLAAVERWWFRIQWAGQDVAMLYYSDDDPEQDFDDLSGDPREALAVWRAECDGSRRIVAEAPSLEATGTHAATGKPVSLRRVVVHMLAEYAQHNGHADLLREALDGRRGQ